MHSSAHTLQRDGSAVLERVLAERERGQRGRVYNSRHLPSHTLDHQLRRDGEAVVPYLDTEQRGQLYT